VVRALIDAGVEVRGDAILQKIEGVCPPVRRLGDANSST
jgi:hypothetical protein